MTNDMNPLRLLTVILCVAVCSHALAQVQEMDKELSNLAEKLAAPIKDRSKKKVAVIDFTDLEGGSSELGKYIAEQLTVNLVLTKRDFQRFLSKHPRAQAEIDRVAADRSAMNTRDIAAGPA